MTFPSSYFEFFGVVLVIFFDGFFVVQVGVGVVLPGFAEAGVGVAVVVVVGR